MLSSLLHFSMFDLLKVFISLFVIINPFGVIPAFLNLTKNFQDDAITINKIIKITSHSLFIVIIVAALAGDLILKIFGITLPSFQIAGGILFGIIAYDAMTAKNESKKQSKEENEENIKKSALSMAVVPLTIPLLSGPGTISLCIITVTNYSGILGYLYIFISALIISIITHFIFKKAEKIFQLLGITGMNILVKITSLLLMALAVEFIMHGMTTVWPILSTTLK